MRMDQTKDEASPSPPAPSTPQQQQHQLAAAAAATEAAAASNNTSMSPAPQHHQHLNYHQQQQLHQRHIQRTGGLQRLTADLAGLQFNDVEALFKIPAHTKRSRKSRHKPSDSVSSRATTAATAPAETSPSQRPHNAAPLSPIQVDLIISEQQQHQQQQQVQPPPPQQHKAKAEQQVPANLAAYEEQMTIAQINSQNGPDFDPARDAQETAEDAQLLKRFKLIGLVGTGNYARVYKIMTQHGKEVACKAINLSKTSENYKQKFLPRELTILRTVSHPNICKTHEIFQYADRIFILMQFCPRGTIADLLYKLGPLSENVTRNFFAQIMDAVCYLHSLDYAHRDLKVENILLDQDFAPKLTDFSYSVNTNPTGESSKNYHQSKSHQSLCSKQVGASNNRQPRLNLPQRAKLNDTFCGTLPYLSPEMIRLLHYDPKKTDIWSLGVCLYVMLNDRLPFPFNDIKQMIRKQLMRDYKFKTSIEPSNQIKDLVGLMLEPDFTRRISSQEVNRHPWLTMGPREKPTMQ